MLKDLEILEMAITGYNLLNSHLRPLQENDLFRRMFFEQARFHLIEFSCFVYVTYEMWNCFLCLC